MIKSTIIEILSNFYILCMRGAKAKFTFRASIATPCFLFICNTYLQKSQGKKVEII